MNSLIYGFETIMMINKNIFCNVRFSVLKVFEIEAGVSFDSLAQGLLVVKAVGHCICNVNNFSQII